MRKLLYISIIVFLTSVLLGYIFSVTIKEKNEKVGANFKPVENTIQTSFEEEKVSYDTTFIIKKCYLTCGHFVYEKCELPLELINKTASEIKEEYPKWNIEDFSSKKIVLSENINSYCDDHYDVKLGNENIEVYQVYDDGEKFLKKTNISRDYLTSEDIEKLERGIEVVGFSRLNAVLEDFE